MSLSQPSRTILVEPVQTVANATTTTTTPPQKVAPPAQPTAKA